MGPDCSPTGLEDRADGFDRGTDLRGQESGTRVPDQGTTATIRALSTAAYSFPQIPANQKKFTIGDPKGPGMDAPGGDPRGS